MEDLNGDGWPDIVFITFSSKLRWFQNMDGRGIHWSVPRSAYNLFYSRSAVVAAGQHAAAAALRPTPVATAAGKSPRVRSAGRE